jgi:hypothetical protein
MLRSLNVYTPRLATTDSDAVASLPLAYQDARGSGRVLRAARGGQHDGRRSAEDKEDNTPPDFVVAVIAAWALSNETGASPRSLWRARGPVNLGSTLTHHCHTEALDALFRSP